ncbi:VWA domain containing CoxE-like protein [Pseudobythopirellula maris]|uniref:VWA domain containing CoxE-like protein n=1 Tax=Pseudobythopirellula maris TaxID=2527991 RepID=A0A5C5ZJ24_9BACT|nr:VWA domain-containing protein [Pseudobythopirellula maris]TWT87188.1 VWA domain containing CoxE-like protein [Pseudobythopirellula maris]
MPNDPHRGADPALARWRLVLGKYAQPRMPECLSPAQERMADALEKLYSREYRGRGVRQGRKLGPGSLDPSQLNVPQWLAELRDLFPQETCQQITGHALDRYQMTELVEDPDVLSRLEPSQELLHAVLSLKGRMKGRVLEEARRLVRRVVDQIKRKLEREVHNALAGRLNRFRRSSMPVARNFDARGTIRRNLKHWSAERQKLVVENPLFFSRTKRHLPWEVILCVDQSGSMVDSVVHSAVMAGILAGLPTVRVRLVVFDTSVVDLSEHVTDPVEVLMTVQLGGGTNIGQAVRYSEGLVSQPRRTVFALVTDFCEGADPRVLIAACKRLRESGVRLLGLAALDSQASPFYDEQLAGRLAAEGMEIAALTPLRFAEWLARVMSAD